MSKPVRISDYLATQLEEIAVRENRSLANLVQHLLIQALAMDNEPVTKTTVQTEPVYIRTDITTTPANERSNKPDDHFKPDFGKKLK